MTKTYVIPLPDELKGGAGSGNYGHEGRPGQRGGSAPGGGVSSGLRLSLVGHTPTEGANLPLVVTDQHGDTWVWKEIGDTTGVFSNHSGVSEVAAYELSKVLGLDCVPETVAVELRATVTVEEWDMGEIVEKQKEIDGLGSAQRWSDGETGKEYTRRRMDQDLDERDALIGREDVIAFDLIIGNKDRHKTNWLVNEGQVVAVDHGHSQWARMLYPRDKHAYAYDLGFNSLLSGQESENRTFTVPSNRIAAWKQLPKERFMQAFANLPSIPGKHPVNPEEAWLSLQTLIEANGVVTF